MRDLGDLKKTEWQGPVWRPQIKSTIDGLLAQVEGGKGKGASADHGTADRATAERME